MNTNQMKNYLNKCVRCGQCRSVCPVFEVIKEEGAAPRGKVFISSLLFAGELSHPGEANNYLSLCLQCRRCSNQCPSGVPVHRIISEARSRLPGSLPCNILYNYLLPSSFLKERAVGLFQMAQKCVLENLAGKTGILPRWLKDLPIHQKAELPPLSSGHTPSRDTVTYYPGCAATYIFPGIARAVLTVLTQHGWDVIIPSDLSCCGFAHETAGNAKSKALGANNYSILAKSSPATIITSCPSCNLALKEKFKNGSAAKQIVDISQFLMQNNITWDINVRLNLKLAYHQPCHETNPASKHLLQRLPGINVIDWKLETTCCGGGGIFMFQHPSVSSEILKPKAKALKKIGTRTLTTTCPVCSLQLRRGLQDSNIEILHPLEIIACNLAGHPNEQAQYHN